MKILVNNVYCKTKLDLSDHKFNNFMKASKFPKSKYKHGRKELWLKDDVDKFLLTYVKVDLIKERNDKIIRLYKDGKKSEAIAMKLKISKYAADRCIIRYVDRERRKIIKNKYKSEKVKMSEVLKVMSGNKKS